MEMAYFFWGDCGIIYLKGDHMAKTSLDGSSAYQLDEPISIGED